MRLLRRLVGAVGQVSSGIHGRISCTSMFKASKKAKSAIVHIRTLMVGKLLHRRKRYSTWKRGERKAAEAEIFASWHKKQQQNSAEKNKRNDSKARSIKREQKASDVKKQGTSSFSCFETESGGWIFKSVFISAIKAVWRILSRQTTRIMSSIVDKNSDGEDSPKSGDCEDSDSFVFDEVSREILTERDFWSWIYEFREIAVSMRQPPRQKSFLQLLNLKSKHFDAG